MITRDETTFPSLFLFIWMQMVVLYEVYTYFKEYLLVPCKKWSMWKLLLVIHARLVSQWFTSTPDALPGYSAASSPQHVQRYSFSLNALHCKVWGEFLVIVLINLS